jgi:hypothetical protein
MKIDTAASWVQVLWFSFVSLGTLYGGFKFWFKFKHKLDNLENYTYKRNSGGSIMDSLARIEARNERQDQALAENTRLTLETVKSLYKLEGRFNNHIEEGAR